MAWCDVRDLVWCGVVWRDGAVAWHARHVCPWCIVAMCGIARSGMVCECGVALSWPWLDRGSGVRYVAGVD